MDQDKKTSLIIAIGKRHSMEPPKDDEPDLTDSAKKNAAQSILDAIDKQDSGLLASALQDFVDSCN
jgi:hypothetical protein